MKVVLPSGLTHDFNEQVVSFLASVLNEPVELVPPEIGSSIIQGYDQLLDGRADFFGALMALTPERTADLPATYPAIVDVPVFEIPIVEDSMRAVFGLIRVFEPRVWYLVLCNSLLFLLTSLLYGRISHEEIGIWNWLKHFINQDGLASRSHQPLSYLVLLTMTSLFTLFSLSLYAGFLLVILLEPRVSPPQINTLDDLIEAIESHQVRLSLITTDHAYTKQIMLATSPYMRRLRNALKDNPPVYAREFQNGKLVRNELPTDRPIVTVNSQLYSVNEYNRFNSCSFIASEVDGLTRNQMSFYFARKYANSSVDSDVDISASNGTKNLMERANQVIIQHQSTLLTMHERYLKNQLAAFDFCRERYVEENSGVGALLVLPVGWIMASIGFGVERLIVNEEKSQKEETELDMKLFH